MADLANGRAPAPDKLLRWGRVVRIVAPMPSPRHPAGTALLVAVLLGCLSVVGTAPLPGQEPPDTISADTASADTTPADTAPADTAAPLPEEISEERSRTDEEIRRELQALFDRVEALSGITVEAEAGIVRLVGTVSEPQAAERAEELARSREGVLYVENRVALTTSVADRLEPTWERLRELALDAVAILPLVAVAFLVVLVSFVVGRLLGRWGGPSFLQSRNPFLQQLVARLIQVVAVLAGLVVALDILEATALVGAVVGTAGLAGLAVGFAFKDIAENYLAGVLLAVRQPFSQNDHVVVEGFEGKVVRLTPRETILMSLEGNHIRLPNALVFGKPMLNYTRNPRRRLHFDVGVGTQDDMAVAREVGIATLREMSAIMEAPPPEALIQDLGDSSVIIRFMGWVDQTRNDFARVRGDAIRLVKLQLEAAGISLPSPEYLIRMQPGPSAVEEDASTARPAPVKVEEEQGDASVDHSVDRQIDEERRESGEENLLQDGGTTSPGDGPAPKRT